MSVRPMTPMQRMKLICQAIRIHIEEKERGGGSIILPQDRDEFALSYLSGVQAGFVIVGDFEMVAYMQYCVATVLMPRGYQAIVDISEEQRNLVPYGYHEATEKYNRWADMKERVRARQKRLWELN